MRFMGLVLITPFIFGFKPLPKGYQGLTTNEVKSLIDTVSKKDSAPQRGSSKTSDSEKVKKLKKEIERLKGANSFNPTFGEAYPEIPTLTRVNGIVEGNVIVSTGSPSTFKVVIVDTNLIPEGTYLACTGTPLAVKYNFRIISRCRTMITPNGEYSVDVSLKDSKSVSGLLPDFVYEGTEESLLGVGFTSLSAGIINAKMERTLTETGFAVNPTFKNALLNGALETAKSANSEISDKTQERSVVLATKTNTKIIVEFNRRFKYEEI